MRRAPIQIVLDTDGLRGCIVSSLLGVVGMKPINKMGGRIARVREDSHHAAKDFVFADLRLGLTFCEIAKKQKHLGRYEYLAGIIQGQSALDAAEKFMWRLKRRHPEFDQMMALAERLKFEIDSLTPRDPD